MDALRSLHNAEKRAALTEAVGLLEPSRVRLLDVGCGPASDLHKWVQLGVCSVLGLDNDPQVIREAVNRSRRYRNRDYRFEVTDDVISRMNRAPPASFHIIVTNFSLHFFAGVLPRFCAAVCRCLVPNGVWVVASIDGDRVPRSLRGRFARVTKSDCGTRMRYSLAGTRYFEQSPPEEPVLGTTTLIREAESQDLRLVSVTAFGARLPVGYPPELTRVTSFHDRILFRGSPA